MKAVLFFILFAFLTFGQKKQVCFSFDDLPVVSYGITDTVIQKRLFDNLISGLEKNNIPAIGFVNEKKLYNNDGKVNQFQAELLKKWIDHDLELGNHTFSHPDYNIVSFKDFTQDILKGEIITKKILSRNGKKIKYFRHPFLHLGNTKEKADSLDNFLSNHEYLTAPVTIDNEDYLFAVAYKRTKVKNDLLLTKQIGHDFVNYIEKKLKYYEKQSNRLFEKNIKQILLLHASWLNSDYIDSLAAMFKKNNYEFVSMDQALEDNVYKTEITVYGNWGISWIDRWALSKGKRGDFFKAEPETPLYIKEMSK